MHSGRKICAAADGRPILAAAANEAL